MPVYIMYNYAKRKSIYIASKVLASMGAVVTRVMLSFTRTSLLLVNIDWLTELSADIIIVFDLYKRGSEAARSTGLSRILSYARR